jgi:hypothetical protein
VPISLEHFLEKKSPHAFKNDGKKRSSTKSLHFLCDLITEFAALIPDGMRSQEKIPCGMHIYVRAFRFFGEQKKSASYNGSKQEELFEIGNTAEEAIN